MNVFKELAAYRTALHVEYWSMTYPKVSPKVQFLTTGGGKLCFNPKFYNCGKSLILVPDPYYNEHVYDISRGTSKGMAASKSYNKTICGYTIYTVIELHHSVIMRNNNSYVEFKQAMI
eukprot:4764369-Ditylum_brightwellii.AAC.1